jgi:hypothetical protein
MPVPFASCFLAFALGLVFAQSRREEARFTLYGNEPIFASVTGFFHDPFYCHREFLSPSNEEGGLSYRLRVWMISRSYAHCPEDQPFGEIEPGLIEGVSDVLHGKFSFFRSLRTISKNSPRPSRRRRRPRI